MHLQSLQIKGFRNLQDTLITPSPELNLIYGINASGKTSLLESIFYLSHVRSFRTSNVKDVINRERSGLLLSAKLQTNDHQVPLGIQRSTSDLQIRLNQQNISRLSDLALQFPVIAIHPDSYQLITGSPSNRRQYMDWGVFHVEHQFINHWRRFKSALKQRNAALKSKQSNKYCISWDKALVDAAVKMDENRSRYIGELIVQIKQLAEQFFGQKELSIEYKRGWASDLSLNDVLEQNLDKDRVKGFTSHGPHRAELVIKLDGQDAQTGISRGQQKILVILLRLAQAQYFASKHSAGGILLFDDLAAELDSRFRGAVLEVLKSLPIQLFLTAISVEDLDVEAWSDKKMFHVEQGCVQEMI